jgi:hypothetical protein
VIADYSDFETLDGVLDPDTVGDTARMIKDKLVERIKEDGNNPDDYYFKPTFYQDENKIVVEAFSKNITK